MNKYTLIKLTDKFILVSDDPKSNGDKCIHLTTFNKSIHHDIDNNLTKWWKIIPEKPDFSLLSKEDCKTIGWYDVEKLFIEKSNIPYFPSDLKETCNWWFIEGFKTAQSLNDKMFSLEDMYMLSVKVVNDIAKNKGNADWNMFTTPKMIANEFIQSLQQTSWDVEIQMEYSYTTTEAGDVSKPKITNNSIKVIKLL